MTFSSYENDNESPFSDEHEIISENLSQRDTRTLIFNLLYAMEAFDYDTSLESIADNFTRGFNIRVTTDSDIFKMASAVVEGRHELDEQIRPLLSNWKLERLGFTTRLILRMAMWEFTHTDLAPSIVINEAVELAKCFGEDDAYKFINGVLDEWIKRNKPEALEPIESSQE